jgi:hypothetical protein
MENSLMGKGEGKYVQKQNYKGNEHKPGEKRKMKKMGGGGGWKECATDNQQQDRNNII